MEDGTLYMEAMLNRIGFFAKETIKLVSQLPEYDSCIRRTFERVVAMANAWKDFDALNLNTGINNKEAFIMQTITKSMIIGEIIQINPSFVPILMNSGMHCLGCPSSQVESLQDACEVHGIDADVLVDKLNEYLAVCAG